MRDLVEPDRVDLGLQGWICIMTVLPGGRFGNVKPSFGLKNIISFDWWISLTHLTD